MNYEKTESGFPAVQLKPKPRKLRQTWIKDVGYHEAPHYLERMGLPELNDFLQVAADRIDYAKLTTPQVLYSPPDWLSRKLKMYRDFDVEPYLDHTYFKFAYKKNCVEEAIRHARKLGFSLMEFMNTGNDVSEKQWMQWRRFAIENSMQFMYEHHPLRNWKEGSPDLASSADEILNTAAPFLDDGAEYIVLDHEEFEIQGAQAKVVFNQIIEHVGLNRVCFEVTSPREGLKQWLADLSDYVRLFGPNCNTCNIMPSQLLQVEPIRDNNLLRQF